VAVALVALVAAAIAGGCARNDGRTMTAPPPGATTPPPTTAAQAGTAGSVPTFALTSPAFTSGSALPVDNTCDGAGTPPPLEWTAPPSSAVELALVLTDANDVDAVHWVVAGLRPEPSSLTGGATPAGAVDLGYDAPCPAPGDQAHVFVFTLYALTSPIGIAAGASAADAAAQVWASPAQAAQLSAFYSR
jgi:phosphatidylethanolamine-binding protein (PEBP) family uncharacterized protein